MLLITHPDWVGGPFVELVTIGTAQKTGIIKSLVTTENPIDVPSKLIRIMSGEAANGYIIFRQMLLEGDWTNRDLPIDYWEDTYNYIALDIKNKPDRLPENYTVTFPAPSNAVAGDKLHINGVEHLNNLYGKGFNNSSSWFTMFAATRLTSGYAEFTQTTPPAYKRVFSQRNAQTSLNPSTSYTIIADIQENKIVTGSYFLSSNVLAEDCFAETVPLTQNSGIGLFKFSVTTKDDLSDKYPMRMYLHNTAAGSITLRTMLLEGDKTAVTLPADYWENTYGIYDILGYGSGNFLESNAFTAGQTVTLSVGLSGAYFASSLNKSLPLIMGGTQDLAVKQVRNMTASANEPVGGVNGDIHIQFGTPNKTWVNDNGIWK